MGVNKRLKSAELRRVLQRYAQDVAKSGADDSELMEMASAFPVWRSGIPYNADDIICFGVNEDDETQLYRVVTAHTSQADWAPDKTLALYKAIGFTDSGVPIWTQPLGAHDAYMKGDKVSHKGRLWTSEADGNVWEPGVYGWKEAAP